jgi:hypothetical protein
MLVGRPGEAQGRNPDLVGNIPEHGSEGGPEPDGDVRQKFGGYPVDCPGARSERVVHGVPGRLLMPRRQVVPRDFLGNGGRDLDGRWIFE